MGGGVSALIALMLHTDFRLLRRVCQSVRAIGLASAAVVDKKLGMACRDFVISVIYGQFSVSHCPTHAKLTIC